MMNTAALLPSTKSVMSETRMLSLFEFMRRHGIESGLVKFGLSGDWLKQFCERNAQAVKDTVIMRWRSRWTEHDPLYKDPVLALRLSEHLQIMAMEGFVRVKPGQHPDLQENAILAIVKKTVESAEQHIVAAAEAADADMHQQVHIQALSATFFETINLLLDAWLDYPTKLATDTRPDYVEFDCAEDISGLIVATYDFDTKRSRSVKEPSPLGKKVDRRGKEVSFEEIAQIFRVSRVTVANIIKAGFGRLEGGMGNEAEEIDVFGWRVREKEATVVLDSSKVWYTEAEATRFLGEDVGGYLQEQQLTCRHFQGERWFAEEDLERILNA